MTASHPALAAFLDRRDDPAPLPPDRAGTVRCHELSDAMDAAVRELMSGVDIPVALLAVGGYGRREQCRHSDVDLALLLPNRPASELREAAGRLLYPLWDAGLKVGYAIRSVAETVDAAGGQLETATALLDARLVAGEQRLFDDFLDARRRAVRRRRSGMEQELAVLRESLLERQPWQLQSVDLKHGRGGLRDLSLIHWLDAASAIAEGRPPPAAPPAGLRSAAERLLATRNAIHAHVDRPSDLYREDLVPRVAGWLRVDAPAWSRDLSLAMRDVDAAAAERIAEALPLHANGTTRLLRWFRRGDDHPDPAESDLDRLMSALAVVDPAHEANVPLEPLPRTEWLRRILPEWEVLRGRRHIAPFHVHPVDVHVMRAVSEAHRLLSPSEEETSAGRAARQGERAELLLAAMLHDIGKGHEAGHVEAGRVIAERFTGRTALPPATAQRLVRAVELHLLLPAVATRRDIADARVIRETAERVGDARTLHLLYALSVADARATGGDVWNAWKAQLMGTLYQRVLEALERSAPEAASSPEQRLQTVIEELAARLPARLVEAHVAGLGPRYLLSTPAESIGDHIELIERARRAPSGTALRRDRLDGLDRLTVATADRPGLLQAVAGTLTAHSASVLGGVAHTRDDGVAIQVWHVSDALGVGIDDRRWDRIVSSVPPAVAGAWPVQERVAETLAAYAARFARVRRDLPTSIHVDNLASDEATVIEVSTADRPGLLYAIARCLHELAIDIHLAKVDTIGPEVVDAFYVTREHGGRIDADDEIRRATERIREAIEELDAPAGPSRPPGATGDSASPPGADPAPPGRGDAHPPPARRAEARPPDAADASLP